MTPLFPFTSSSLTGGTVPSGSVHRTTNVIYHLQVYRSKAFMK